MAAVVMWAAGGMAVAEEAAYAATAKLNLIVGVNNGWTNSQDTADGTDQTLEAGLAYTPSKTVARTLQGYFGRHAHLSRARCEASTATIGTAT
jgi:hypothetical protein